jgi:hypothetical protein
MVVCRYVLLVFMLALLYAGTWARASGQSPPERFISQTENRLGMRFGVSGASVNGSRFLAGFTSLGQLNMGIEYGQRSGNLE